MERRIEKRKRMVIIAAAVIAVGLAIAGLCNGRRNSQYTFQGIVVDTYEEKIRVYTEGLITADTPEIVDVIINENGHLPKGLDIYQPLLNTAVIVQYDGTIATLGPPFLTGARVKRTTADKVEIEKAQNEYKASTAYLSRSGLNK